MNVFEDIVPGAYGSRCIGKFDCQHCRQGQSCYQSAMTWSVSVVHRPHAQE